MEQERNFDFREHMKMRTKDFALRVIRMCRALPSTDEAQIIKRQILRSATSVGANYRAACRARSNAEFFSKISIVIEEADETLFWLEVLQETGIFKPELLETLYKENEEILKIMVSARSKSKRIAENQPVG